MVPLGLFHICDEWAARWRGADPAWMPVRRLLCSGTAPRQSRQGMRWEDTLSRMAQPVACQIRGRSAVCTSFSPLAECPLGQRREGAPALVPAHLLQAELLDARLIGSDGRALDAHIVLLRIANKGSRGDEWEPSWGRGRRGQPKRRAHRLKLGMPCRACHQHRPEKTRGSWRSRVARTPRRARRPHQPGPCGIQRSASRASQRAQAGGERDGHTP